MKDRIAGVARVAKIAGVARIADERPTPVGIGRKSCRNTENLARMHQPPVDLLCLQGASTAGRREVRIVESGVEERHAQYRQSKGESD